MTLSKKEILLIGGKDACNVFFSNCVTNETQILNNRVQFSNVIGFDFCCSAITHNGIEFIVRGLPGFENSNKFLTTPKDKVIDHFYIELLDAIIILEDATPELINKFEEKRKLRNLGLSKECCIAIKFSAVNSVPLKWLELIDSLQKTVDRKPFKKLKYIIAGALMDENCIFSSIPTDITKEICTTYYHKYGSFFSSLPKEPKVQDNSKLSLCSSV